MSQKRLTRLVILSNKTRGSLNWRAVFMMSASTLNALQTGE